MNDRYIVECEFEHAGYKCVVVFTRMGHRCGYVGIPKEHPLYGKGYDEHLEIKKSDLGDREVKGVFLFYALTLMKMKEYELKHIFSVTAALHMQVVESIQVIQSKAICGGLVSIADTQEISRI